LGERKKIIQSGISNGVILQDNMLAMDAQEISLMQKITELKITEGQLINVLRILTDSNISSNLVIAEPPEINLNGSNSSRPEYSLFQNQKEKLDAGIQLVASADLPRLYAFSQFAYGRPGYNIVSRDFHTFYTVGAAAKWNILGWGENRRQIRILELQKEMIDVKKDLFDDRLNIQLEKERYDIVKYDSLINQDIEIVRLRKAITVSAMSRLNNGVITATDFLTDMNAEIVASLQLENHRILKLQATYNYAIMQGNY
jgi:outer membrane protein TolC